MSGPTRKVTLAQLLREWATGAERAGEATANAMRAGAREVERTIAIEYNPLRVARGDIALIRTKEHRGRRFVVDAVNVTAREILGERHLFADYVLTDKNPSGGQEDALYLVLRIVPRQKNATAPEAMQAFILNPQFECAYDKTTHQALERGELPVDDVAGKGYVRPAGIAKAYTATVTEHGEEKKESMIDYWDFVAQTDDGVLSLYIVEMDRETGWFQTYAGIAVDPKAVEFLRAS